MASTSSAVLQRLATAPTQNILDFNFGDDAFFTMLRSKNIDPVAFLSNNDDLTPQSPLADHVRRLYQTIYSVPYPEHCSFLVAKSDPMQGSFDDLPMDSKRYRFAIVLFHHELYYANAWKKLVTKITATAENQAQYDQIKAACENIESGSYQNALIQNLTSISGSYDFTPAAFPLIHALTGQTHVPKKSYQTPPGFVSGIARYIHGITHVTSVAILIPILENLFRKYGVDLESLSTETIRLGEIAALFHDAAREDEGVDRWDHESALMLYYYLRRVLGVAPETAKFIAEAMANKDLSEGCGLLTLTTDPSQYRPCGLIDLSRLKLNVDIYTREIPFESLVSELKGHDAVILYQGGLYYACYESQTVKPLSYFSNQIKLEDLKRFKKKITPRYQLAHTDDDSFITLLTGRDTPFEVIEGKLKNKSAIILADQTLYFADYDSKTVTQIKETSDNQEAVARFKAGFTDTWQPADQDALSIIRSFLANTVRDKGYFFIDETEDGQISWGFDVSISNRTFTKNRVQRLIHDGDCLEIKRARAHFEPRYLDLFQHLDALSEGVEKQQAIEELSLLISEERSLIAKRGDSFVNTDPETKRLFEQEQALSQLLANIDPEDHSLVSRLRQPGLPLEAMQDLIDTNPYDPAAPLTNENLRRAKNNGQVYIRGLFNPSQRIQVGKHAVETNESLELRKVFRRTGVATSTSKPNRLEKWGNPNRSISLLGSGIFSDTGFLIFGLDLSAVSLVSSTDVDSGFGKKDHLRALEGQARPSIEEIRQLLANLHHQLKLGGDSKKWSRVVSTHSELLYLISRYNAIYFSNDPNFTDSSLTKAARASSFLQAVYLRQGYERVYDEIKAAWMIQFGDAGAVLFTQQFGEKKFLPIVEYSEQNHRFRLISETVFSDDYLVEQWRKMISVYFQEKITKGRIHIERTINTMPVDLMKISAMYDHGTPSGCLLVALKTDPVNTPFCMLSSLVADRNAVVLFKNQLFFISQVKGNLGQNVFKMPIPKDKQLEFNQLKSQITSEFQEADFQTCQLINEAITLINRSIGVKYIPELQSFAPADQYYSNALKSRVNDAILNEIQQLINRHETAVIERYHRGELTFLVDGSIEFAFQTRRIREELKELARAHAIKTYEAVNQVIYLYCLWYFLQQFDLTEDFQARHHQRCEEVFLAEITPFTSIYNLNDFLIIVMKTTRLTETMASALGEKLIDLLNLGKVSSLPLFFKWMAVLEPRHFSTGGLREEALLSLLKQINLEDPNAHNLIDSTLCAYEKLLPPAEFLQHIQTAWEGIWSETMKNPDPNVLLELARCILKTRLPGLTEGRLSFVKPEKSTLNTHLGKTILVPVFALAGAGIATAAMIDQDNNPGMKALLGKAWGSLVKSILVGGVSGWLIGTIVDRKRKARFEEPFNTLNQQLTVTGTWQKLAGILNSGESRERVIEHPQNERYQHPVISSSLDYDQQSPQTNSCKV